MLLGQYGTGLLLICARVLFAMPTSPASLTIPPSRSSTPLQVRVPFCYPSAIPPKPQHGPSYLPYCHHALLQIQQWPHAWQDLIWTKGVRRFNTQMQLPWFRYYGGCWIVLNIPRLSQQSVRFRASSLLGPAVGILLNCIQYGNGEGGQVGIEPWPWLEVSVHFNQEPWVLAASNRTVSGNSTEAPWRMPLLVD